MPFILDVQYLSRILSALPQPLVIPEHLLRRVGGPNTRADNDKLSDEDLDEAEKRTLASLRRHRMVIQMPGGPFPVSLLQAAQETRAVGNGYDMRLELHPMPYGWAKEDLKEGTDTDRVVPWEEFANLRVESALNESPVPIGRRGAVDRGGAGGFEVSLSAVYACDRGLGVEESPISDNLPDMDEIEEFGVKAIPPSVLSILQKKANGNSIGTHIQIGTAEPPRTKGDVPIRTSPFGGQYAANRAGARPCK
ncbi:hypothetical protein EI94DRAFT_1705184 [Lactarius quietus]|nr:hypothetical protein EI94DRAFT_1705184 [Lactarius quietus]